VFDHFCQRFVCLTDKAASWVK